MHEVSGLGWDCSSSIKQVFTTLKVDDTLPTYIITRSFYASASFIVYLLLCHGGVIRSAVFFSMFLKRTKNHLYLSHFYFSSFFICYIMFL